MFTVSAQVPGAHVITISPPMNMNPYWLGMHPAYTLSKYGMTLLSLGWAVEYADAGIGFNCLWPETYIATAAVANSGDGEQMRGLAQPGHHGRRGRRDPVRARRHRRAGIATSTARSSLRQVSDLSRYGGGPAPIMDIFVDR